ncbi:hypothetical protein SAM23877_6936 [Streptomyces ambofaciens ATCC 23877]|uniref:Uncharacterized protein n=1 Tax=Streptomyces ambofaciens (strain ATCC 23877 / 3486 / DSM 40053 / JCM 4204 / NBRC 12836 / NRRL B-2516) TaxID=278992 RepID=A0A0K2B4B9_STRA7|nr:hypothetical protein SAM23877_6936 [Streptomyces ambofaciens ATCC 23877]
MFPPGETGLPDEVGQSSARHRPPRPACPRRSGVPGRDGSPVPACRAVPHLLFAGSAALTVPAAEAAVPSPQVRHPGAGEDVRTAEPAAASR